MSCQRINLDQSCIGWEDVELYGLPVRPRRPVQLHDRIRENPGKALDMIPPLTLRRVNLGLADSRQEYNELLSCICRVAFFM
jgi:hypothetical protein